MKKIISILLGCIILVVGGIWVYNQYFKQIPEFTLKEAAKKGFEVAKKWNPKAALYDVTSMEEEKDVKDRVSKGKNGKRSKWNLIFCVPSKKECRYIKITGDKIETVDPGITYNYLDQGVSLAQIQVDSPALLKKAIKQFDLQPRVEGYGQGYHFELLKTDIKKKYVYVVKGVQKDGEDTDPQSIYFYLNGKHYGNKFDNNKK